MAAEYDATCPHCGRVNEVHADPTSEEVPEAGDVSICWKCMHVGIYNEDGSIRKPTVEEMAELDQDLELKDALVAARFSTTPAEADRRRNKFRKDN